MILSVGDIVMEQFAPRHSDALYALINHPHVRRGMRRGTPIQYEDHLRWVEDNLVKERKVHLFVAGQPDALQGVALLKNLTADGGELGLMVSEHDGNALLTGKLITGILYYAFEVLDRAKVTMSILPGNKASLAVAEKIGAVHQGTDETYRHYSLDRQQYQHGPLIRLLLARYRPRCTEEAFATR